jgi:hypothetical protein
MGTKPPGEAGLWDTNPHLAIKVVRTTGADGGCLFLTALEVSERKGQAWSSSKSRKPRETEWCLYYNETVTATGQQWLEIRPQME